ncbi:hypothetical protein N2152v2_009302 [Parachlorella kessleri]
MAGLGALYAGRRLLQLAQEAAVPASMPIAAHEGREPLSPGQQVAFIVISVALTILAGLMSGLTLGLMSLDRVDTEVIKRSGSPKQRWLVERIEPVLSHPHHLLVTLLLTNAVAMEALPIFLDRLLNPVAAILISVSAVLLFGEVIPQAVCKRYGLQVGAYLAWFVRALMLLTAPISYPIAKLLDYLLGEESALFRRAELKALVSMHAEPVDEGGDSTLTQDEVFMVPSDSVVDRDLLRQVIHVGHSRVPVFEGSRQNIIGVILVKELVLVDEDDGIIVKDLRLREVPFLRADIPLYEIFKIFRTGRSHMAVLTRPPGGSLSTSPPLGDLAAGQATTQGAPVPEDGSVKDTSAVWRTESQGYTAASKQLAPPEAIGIITIEDVLEELLQAEIVDETDRYVDNLQTVRTTTLLSMQHLPADLRKFITRTFRVASPASRAAFQAALAAQSPFGASPPPPAGTLATAGSGIAVPQSAVGDPQKQVAYAAAVAAAAAAAAAAEDAASRESSWQLQPADGGSGPLQPLLQRGHSGRLLVSWDQPQQPGQRHGAQHGRSRSLDGNPGALGRLPGLHEGSASASQQQQRHGSTVSPSKPPLPKLRVQSGSGSLESLPLLGGSPGST